MENQARTIVKQANIDFWGRVFGKVLGYVFILILTNLLAPAEYGIFRLLLSIVGIATSLAMLGLTGVLDRYIPIFLVNLEYGKIKFLVKKILSFSVSAGAVLFLFIFFLAPQITDLFNTNGLAKEFTQGLRLVAITIPVLTATQLLYYIFISHKKLFYPVLIENILQPVIKILAVGIALFLGLGLTAWIGIHVAIILLIMAAALYILHRNLLKWWRSTEEQPIDTKEIFHYTWPLSISAVLTLSMAQIMPLVLGFYRPPAEVAVFTIYFATISILVVMENAVAKIFKPIASENGQLLLIETNFLFKRIVRWSLLFAGAATVIVTFYGRQIILLLFSKSYLLTPEALIILAAGFFVSNITGPTSALLESQGKTKLLLGLTVLHISLVTSLSFLLIPRSGLIGAAAAFSISYALINLITIIYTKKHFDINPFSRRLLNASLVLIIFAGVTWLAKIFLPVSTLWLIAIGIVLLIIFTGLIWFFKAFDNEDWGIIKSIHK